MTESRSRVSPLEIAQRDIRETLTLLRPWRNRFALIMAGALVLLPFSSRIPLYAFVLSIALAAVLAALVVIDLDTFRLPDTLTLPLIAAGVLSAPPLMVLDTLERLAAAMVGFALIYAVAEGYRRWRGTAGIGLGDAKLFAAAGAWCTVEGLPSVLLVATLSALAVTAAMAYLGGKPLARSTRIAFGPYIALGFWIVWLFGPLP